MLLQWVSVSSMFSSTAESHVLFGPMLWMFPRHLPANSFRGCSVGYAGEGCDQAALASWPFARIRSESFASGAAGTGGVAADAAGAGALGVAVAGSGVTGSMPLSVVTVGSEKRLERNQLSPTIATPIAAVVL